MDLVYVFLIWILVAAPAVANSCISRSAVCCMVGPIEGKIFFDEIEGPGCSNRGKIQVILNLVGFQSQGYNNEWTPQYHFRLKTYGEILPSCSGVGSDYGSNGGHVTSVQPFEDGSVYNDTIFLPSSSSGLGTDDLIGRSLAVYEDPQTGNNAPLACCVIGRGQPVTLPVPTPTSPTPLGPQDAVDLTVAKQTQGPASTFQPATLNQYNAPENSAIVPKNAGGDRLLLNNKNAIDDNAYPGAPNKGAAFPGNNNNYNNNNNINDAGHVYDQNNNINDPKYRMDEEEIDRKFNLIGGYGGDSNFGFQPNEPNRNSEIGFSDNNNYNGKYNNIYNAGNNKYNANRGGVFGPSSASRGNSPFQQPSSNNGRGYSFNDGNSNNNNNNHFNSFGNGNRGQGFGSSQFPSVFGSIGSGKFFNLDGKLAGAAIVNGNPQDSARLGQGVGGVLGSSLGNGFEPPKGPSFQDIYNKPTGESPLSSGGFTDTVSPDEQNGISRLFFSDAKIKDTIGLTSEDRFIPRETEDEEDSTSYQSDTNSNDSDDVIGDDRFGPDVKNDDNFANNNDAEAAETQLAPSEADPVSIGSISGTDSPLDLVKTEASEKPN